jgi:peptidyl-prolyl cis-trans isomerase SurA
MRLIAIFCLLLMYAAGYAQKAAKTEGSDVLFMVDKKPVLSDEFTYLYKKNHTKKEDFTEAKEDEYLNLLIIFKLKIAEARARGLDKTPAFHKEFDTYREELKKPWIGGKDDLDRLTKEAYDHLKEEIKAVHILITVKPDALPADTLIAWNKISALRLRAVGGEDFEKIAMESSEDPSAKTNGGNLGYFTAMQMVYPFEEGAFATPKGEISPIVRTRFGYHIIKVIDRVPSRGEVEVAHILLRGNDPKVKNQIFDIYDQLKAGRPWDELVKQYSEDSNTKNSGGKLRRFGVAAFAQVPEFEQVAFSLKTPGEISDPFQSKVGWHIIRLEKKIPLLPFKEMEQELKRKVSRDERYQISKAQNLMKRKTEMGFSENAENRKLVFDHADSTLLQGKWKYEPTVGLTIFSLQGQPITVAEFVEYTKSHHSPTALTALPYVSKLYNDFVEQKIGRLEELALAKDNPEYRMLLKEYEEGILLFEIMEKEVWNKASEDSIGQHKYYDTHVAKYTAGNRVEARIFSTPDQVFFNNIKAKIAKGDTLTAADMKRFKSVQNKKAYERGDSKVVDKVNWVFGTQETEVDGVYYLVDVIRLVPPGVKSFSDSRAGVISDYQDMLEKTWVEALRQKYPVKINKKARKAVIAKLNK